MGWQPAATPTAELSWCQARPPSVRGCLPHSAHPHLPAPGQIFSNQIWDVARTALVTGGMEVGVQRSQNPQYYGVWRTVVGQKCPVREVQWAGGVHRQGVRGAGQQQGDSARVVQGRSSREGSWRGERRGCWPPALYHRLALLILVRTATSDKLPILIAL